MGPLQFNTPYGRGTPYYAPSCYWPPYYLYKFLADDPDALGTCILDNKHLITARRDRIEYTSDLEHQGEFATGYGCTSDFSPLSQVGWIRTMPPRMDVNIPPYTLYIDKAKRTTLDYVNYFTIPQAIPCKDPSLYWELVKNGGSYVYMTPNGPIFV